MICPNCKAEIADGSRFCGRCGTEISQEPVPVYETAPPQSYGYQPADNAQAYGYQGNTAAVVQKKSKKPLIITLSSVGGAILLAVIIILVLVFGFKACDKSKGSPQDAFDDMISLFNEGKYSEVIKKYSFDGGESVNFTQVEQYQGLLSSIKWSGQVLQVQTYQKGTVGYDSALSEVTTDARYTPDIIEVAALKVSMTYSAFGRSESDETTIYMARYKGAWKVADSSSVFNAGSLY